MSRLARRGFTIIELMVALVILGIVSAGIYKVLTTNQQTYLAQTQRIDLQQNIRAAATILPAELREMNTAGPNSDITAMGTTFITFRAMRQLAFLCAPEPPLGGGIGQIVLTVRRTLMFGNRQTFSVGDSLLVYYEGNKLTRNDDSWLKGEIKKVDFGNCLEPPNNPPAYVLTLAPGWLAGSQFNVAGAISVGSPLRVFSTVTYGLWLSPSDNQYYVAQTANGSTQPLIGPLSGANGLAFQYFDSLGNVTADSSKVADVEIRVRGRTASKVRTQGQAGVAYRIDSLVTRVAIRNNTRCNPCN